ncbi:Cell division cycle-associated 7-like protein [Neolecta irregularis DAH-3]|uniref:Cell division cycle-associated 7-like protein n=1 Tax=Neolecta irregularis (strain DAH-3) TaxID=1198029 RepID=A0A1U7LLT1_NEOID|nr:Cell division cycle-associated 7-like protein [Neolecta irregularis DAH-3]|eukprot:OLL23599.1 Cell division cycle-associated 7-like protein [Neolecta irregularis DAH-3]
MSKEEGLFPHSFEEPNQKELAPTGILAHFTKQNGVSSVLDLKQSNPKALEKLKPLKSIHAAPKEVKQPITIKRQQVISEPPIFEPIDIPDDKIWWHRLEIREFVIRCAKSTSIYAELPVASLLKIQPKHLQTFNDLQAEWSNLALKNLIVRLLRIIYNDGNPTFDDEMLLKTHKEIEKQSADKEFIWTLLRRLLESAIRLDKAPGQLNEEERLWMVICLIDLVLDGESIRKQMEHDIDTLHTLIKSHTDKTKTIKEEYSNRRSELFAKRVQMKTSQWQSELEIFMKQHTALLQPLEFKLFERSRELSTKTGFLGEDYHGTRYYVLSQRPRNTNRNWGSYLLALSEDGKWQRIVDGIEIIKCAQWVRTSATVYCPAINKPRRGGTTSDSGVIADQTSIGEISTMMKAIVEVVVVEIPPRTRESIIDCAEKIERLGKYVQFKWPMKEDQLNAMAAD